MQIIFPNIKQSDFEYAFACLEECKQPNAVAFGFPYPYFTPGGASYGQQWWQLDSSLALSGYKWKDRKFSETALLNFVEAQKSDGRICLWGNDNLPKQVAGGNPLQQTDGVSSLPKIFDVAYHITKGTANQELIEKIYVMLNRYLDWWYSDRYDTKTGLFSAVFEETFIPYLGSAMEYAAVDTNVEIYVGLIHTAELAEKLQDIVRANELRQKAEALKDAINTYLWNKDKGAYYPYDLKRNGHVDCLMASTFYPLRMKIAPPEYKRQLLSLLKDNEEFNWDLIPLTSVSKKDPVFQVTYGDYQGNASWSGNVWTLINEMVVRGLLDSGEKELAAELTLKTLYAFNNNYTEFINPFDSSGHGVLRYAWTASQYLELIIEIIFGISVNIDKNEVIISPNLPECLKFEELSLKGIMVFDNVYLDVSIKNGKIDYQISDDMVKVYH